MTRQLFVLSTALAIAAVTLAGQAARGGEAGVDALWSDLASDDAPAGYRAIRALTRRPDEALALFRARLRLPEAAAPAVIDGLIRDLDSDRFAVRQKAAAELALLGHQAGPAGPPGRPGAAPGAGRQAVAGDEQAAASAARPVEGRPPVRRGIARLAGDGGAGGHRHRGRVPRPGGARRRPARGPVVEEASACLQRLARRKPAP